MGMGETVTQCFYDAQTPNTVKPFLRDLPKSYTICSAFSDHLPLSSIHICFLVEWMLNTSIAVLPKDLLAFSGSFKVDLVSKHKIMDRTPSQKCDQ